MSMEYKSSPMPVLAKVMDVAPENCKLSITESDNSAADGLLEGYASVFGNVDSGREVVQKGAFQKTIKEGLGKGIIKLVDSHKSFSEGTEAVIGVVTAAEEDSKGLKFQARFSSTHRAQEIRTKIKEGILGALSFGYDVIKDEVDEVKKIRYLKELRLYEISVVPWGMNPKAMIGGVKSSMEEKGVVKIGNYAVAPLDAQWNHASALAHVKEWVGTGDWSAAQWAKFRSVHLWVGANPTTEGAYKFLACDIFDGSPNYVFRSAAASLAIVRGGRGANTSADWWGDRSSIEKQIGAIYKKFGRELPKKEATPDGAGIIEADEEAVKELAALMEDIQQAVADAEIRALIRGMRV